MTQNPIRKHAKKTSPRVKRQELETKQKGEIIWKKVLIIITPKIQTKTKPASYYLILNSKKEKERRILCLYFSLSLFLTLWSNVYYCIWKIPTDKKPREWTCLGFRFKPYIE